MVHFPAMALLLEFRLAARLAGLIGWAWWMLAPLWLLFAVTILTLAGWAVVADRHERRAGDRPARGRALTLPVAADASPRRRRRQGDRRSPVMAPANRCRMEKPRRQGGAEVWQR
jgi:hypothetical protein